MSPGTGKPSVDGSQSTSSGDSRQLEGIHHGTPLRTLVEPA